MFLRIRLKHYFYCLFVCLFVFLQTTTLYFIFTYKGKITKIVENWKKKVAKLQFTQLLKKGKKKQTNKETANLNRTVKVLNRLIYRAPPTVHFHRIVHSFKEGRFLIESISF